MLGLGDVGCSFPFRVMLLLHLKKVFVVLGGVVFLTAQKQELSQELSS